MSDSSITYRLDDQVGYVLRRATQRHVTIFQNAIPEGLTPTQFSALVRLAEVGPCSQNQLGRLTSMDVATIKGVVDRLVRKELVVLTSDPNDKRRSIISLSPSAEALVSELHQKGNEVSAATLKPLSAEEQELLVDLLKRIA